MVSFILIFDPNTHFTLWLFIFLQLYLMVFVSVIQMLQIFRKDNGSFWTEIRARNKAISASNKEKAAAGGVPVVDRNDYSGGAAGNYNA